MASSRDKPHQKELVYNRHLPYAEHVPGEAERHLAEILCHLSRAVQQSELWPGALFWTNRLHNYLRVYGHAFSKEEHVRLVHLLYELVTIPNLESPLLHTWCSLLTLLLKKWRLLTPDDLQLDWRPLYDLSTHVFCNKYSDLGMKLYPPHTTNAVHMVIAHARNYFPLESTREMLEEWRPLLCPFDMAMVEGVSLLADFLPNVFNPDHHQHGFKLWFDELLQLWLGAHGPTPTDELFLKLFVRVAKFNIGYIDWTPHMPEIFSRILRSFQLPVGAQDLRVGVTTDHFNTGKAATFIVCMLGGGQVGQEHLDRLMVALESYYHPSNVGKHTRKLLHFLKELALQFILRLKRERYSKAEWFRHTPQHYKLSEEDVTRFVVCLLPAVKMAMFSKFGTMEAAVTLNNLALVRPELVLPDLLNSTYTALETLTEPHQVTATLQCLTTVSRVLLSGGGGRYLEGRRQLMSLLMLALPGIDPNDYRKTLVSGLLISALLSSIPLVDCSPAVGKLDLTEDETELCHLSAGFEDFGLQLLDRCFALVENTRLEQVSVLDRFVSAVGANTQESIMGLGASGSVYTLLSQSSPELFKVFLEKIYRFATSHVFESELAGRMCADMCAATAKVDNESAFKLFIPHCVRTIAGVLAEPGQEEAEHPDPTLTWTIHLLSQVLNGNGRAFLGYADQLIACLSSCVHLKSKSAALHAAKALNQVLHCLTSVYPLEFKSTATGFAAPPDCHNYIKEWAVAGDIKELCVQWHVPSREELALTDRILTEFLQPELTCIEAMVTGGEGGEGSGEGGEGGGGKTMEREERYRCLQLVQYLLLGVASYLPLCSGQPVEGLPGSIVSLTRDFYLCTSKDATPPPEQFSRAALSQLMHRLAQHVLSTCEDDTKTMFKVVEILKILLTNPGSDSKEFEAKWRVYKQSKNILENKLHGKKQATRTMIIERICLQHELRMLERNMSPVTPLHLQLLQDLFKMSVSHYSEVRVKAQSALSSCFSFYLFSSRLLLPDVFPLLRNSGSVSHEQFKGALYVMLLPSMMNMFLHDWDVLRQTLPALVRADHSEKPTILALMSKLLHTILAKYEYAQLQFQVSEGCIAAAETLHGAMGGTEKEAGRAKLDRDNQTALDNYTGLVHTLVELVEQEKLQWRYSQMGVQFLVMLIRHDQPLPVDGVRLIVASLIHDSLAMRKLALKGVPYLLLQQKRRHLKVPVDIEKEAGCAASYSTPGEREDTQWLCYQPETLPTSQEQWDTFPFIDKTHWGYYTWPKVLYKYAPYDQQPPLNRAKEDLSESELVFYEALTSQEFVDKLVGFFSLEEVKGKDQFDVQKFDLFKGLSRNFGSVFLPFFQSHLERLAVDSQESSQRFASAAIAGMVSGSKHWNHSMVCELRSVLEPLLEQVLSAVTPETIRDWSTCFTEISANRDPRKIGWLLELLMVDPLRGQAGSFNDASRLHLLQSALAQQEWRAAPLLHRLVAYLRPHLTHPFKNVRERIGSVLAQVYLHDVDTARFNPTRKELLPFLSLSPASLTNGQGLPPPPPPPPPSPPPSASDEQEAPSSDKTAIKLAETLLAWLISSFDHSNPDEFHLLSQTLPLVAVDDDKELRNLLNGACAQIAHSELSLPTVRVVVDSLKKAMDSGLWRVRVAALQLLQVVVFKNLFLFSALCLEIADLLLCSIRDPKIEVRELAASTLGGLVGCGFIQSVDKLKGLFISSARSKLPRRNKTAAAAAGGAGGGRAMEADTHYEAVLLERHSGVLGLSALLEACPYSVPQWLPEVIDEMALHLHDPAPIQGTVRKAMSEFRRTHYDNWTEHKKQFTDDQLSVLADLLISPSYYA